MFFSKHMTMQLHFTTTNDELHQKNAEKHRNILKNFSSVLLQFIEFHARTVRYSNGGMEMSKFSKETEGSKWTTFDVLILDRMQKSTYPFFLSSHASFSKQHGRRKTEFLISRKIMDRKENESMKCRRTLKLQVNHSSISN